MEGHKWAQNTLYLFIKENGSVEAIRLKKKHVYMLLHTPCLQSECYILGSDQRHTEVVLGDSETSPPLDIEQADSV